MFDHTANIGEYLSLEPLATRIRIHREYSELPDDVEAAVIDATAMSGSADLLDVGCGTGSFLRRLADAGHQGRLVGFDMSPAAVEALRELPGIEARQGDACALPFGDGEFDVVTARHMLYHVSDVEAAVREAHRVLRPGGVYTSTVNHPDATPKVAELIASVLTGMGLPVPVIPRALVHSDNLAGFVQTAFGDVTVHKHDNALVFPEPPPLIAFAVAQLAFYGVGPDSPHRADVAARLEEAARAAFARHGEWRDPKGYVVCVARRHAERS